jgi:pSer/pThr/pTyr-binding forkhead associated (FHA) protein
VITLRASGCFGLQSSGGNATRQKVGRGEENDIVIPHASVSRTHARLTRRGGIFELTDLNSTNGSYVNDRPVQGNVTVASGSEVRFGDIRFVLSF